jgi:hypothetical protein
VQANQSWTATIESNALNTNPSRTIESHTKSGNRTVDKQSVEVRGLDGRFEPYEDIEKETVQVDAGTVRITTRTFGRDVHGAKTPVRVTEEEQHTLPNGDSKLVRTTSSADMNATFTVSQRETVETKRIAANVEEIDSTLVMPTVNGLAPVLKTHEIRKRGADDTEESEKSIFLLDVDRKWQLSEIRQTTIRREGNMRIREERISCRDYQGKLNEVDRIISKETEDPPGEKRSTLETYSLNVPGLTQDASLHLVERATTVQRTNTTGEQVTEQKLAQANAGDPHSGLRLNVVVNDTVRQGPSGTQETRTTQKWDAMGKFGIVSIEMTTSDRIASNQLQQKQ